MLLVERTWIAEHVDIEQLGHVAALVLVLLVTKAVPNVGRLFLYHSPLLSCRSGRTHLPNEISEAHRRAEGPPQLGLDLIYFLECPYNYRY